MQEKVFKAGIQREYGWLYYIKNGLIMRSRMKHHYLYGENSKPEVVLKTDIKPESGFMYFLDKQGDMARTEMKNRTKGKKIAKEIDAPLEKEVSKPLTSSTAQIRKEILGGSMELEEKTGKGSYSSKIKGTKIYHKEGGPAHISHGRTEYLVLGQLHREGGPAVEQTNLEEYYWRGMLHRIDGPAIITKRKDYYSNRFHTSNEYYLFGTSYSKPEFDKIVTNKELLERLSQFMGAPTHTAAVINKKSEGSFAPLFAVAAGLAGAGFMFGHSRGAKVATKATAKIVKSEQVRVGAMA